jgi:hypothetical protein
MSNKVIEWVYDKPPASGTSTGASIGEQNLKSSSKLKGKLTRESGSNSGDQCLNPNDPVEIYYDLIEISGNDKREFLDALDWTNLAKHLKGASKNKNNDFRLRIHKGLETMKKPKIYCLRVSDYNTRGLIGGEDEEENFRLFSKSTLETQSTSSRQGSFGIGKGVFWLHSEISTVIFSSSVPKKNKWTVEQ